MRSTYSIFTLLLFIMLSFTGHSDNGPQTKKTSLNTTEHYVCPMHPEVISTHKENCSICGMYLKKTEASVKSTQNYVCPMHPEILSDHKENCSICGMYLEKKKIPEKTDEYYVCPLHPEQISEQKERCRICNTHMKETAAPIKTTAYYVCPMHPKIISDHKENCSICGMHLQKKEVSVRTSTASRHKCERPVPSKAELDEMRLKEVEADQKIAQEANSKPRKNPYLMLQYKKKTSDDDTHQNSINTSITKSADIGSNPLYNTNTAQKKQDKAVQSHTGSAQKKTDIPASYICPMHPSIISDHKENCPICGMYLVKQKKQSDSMDGLNTLKLSSAIVQKIGVKTMAVVRGILRKSLKTGGNVGYNEDRLIDLTSRTDGWVENLSLRRSGMMVKRGQLLMEMYSPEYLEAQKEFLQAQKIDKSAGQLKNYARRDETVHVRDTLRYLQIPESAINELARKGKTRHRIPIYAPQYGEVVQLNVKNHSYVDEGDIMLTIADLSSVWIEVNIFQHQLQWLQRNQKAEVVVDILPGKILKGQVNAIAAQLDPRTHTAKVRVLVPNPDYLLRPNMYAQVTIFDNAQKDILKIPRQALIATGDRTSVIKALGDGLFMPVDVVAGLHSGDEVEIISGLHEGDLVVSSGQFLIDSEANLRASFQRLSHTNDKK